jgi:hypothetical protein
MRSQVYEWDAANYNGTVAQTLPAAGRSVSIFVGGFGNNITKPAETTATEFVVIEDIAVTPSTSSATEQTGSLKYRGLLIATTGTGVAGPRAYVQVRINTTDYFLDPDNVPNDGIPGTASPYPRSVDFQPSFNLYPDVYVLPGQVWDILVTYYLQSGVGNGAGTALSGDFRCFTKYTLYDGPDALIANKLLEMGISINPGNVDWYKRSLLSA